MKNSKGLNPLSGWAPVVITVSALLIVGCNAESSKRAMATSTPNRQVAATGGSQRQRLSPEEAQKQITAVQNNKNIPDSVKASVIAKINYDTATK